MRDPIYSEYPLISNYKGPDAGNRVVGSDIGKSEWREPGWIAWLAGENQRRQRICGCRRTVQNMNRDGLCAWIRRSIGRDSHSPRHTRGNGAFQVAGSRIAACPAHSLSRSAGCCSDNDWSGSAWRHEMVGGCRFCSGPGHRQICHRALQDLTGPGDLTIERNLGRRHSADSATGVDCRALLNRVSQFMG